MYLIFQILVFLLLAALIGFAAGWYWRRCREQAGGGSVELVAESGPSHLEWTALRGERDEALRAVQDMRERLAAAPAEDVDALKRSLLAKETERAATAKHASELRDQLAATLNLDSVRKQRDEALVAKAALERELVGVKSAANQTPALASFEALHRKTDELRAGGETMRQQFERMQALLAESTQLRGALGAMGEAKGAVETELAALRERLTLTSSERDAANEKARVLQAELAGIAQMRSDLEAARGLKASADTEIVELRRQVQAGQSQAPQLARLTAERDAALRQAETLQQQLQAALNLGVARKDRDEAVAARGLLETELAKLRGQLAGAPKPIEFEALRSKLAELEARYAAAAQEAQDLRNQLGAAPDVAEIERARDLALADRARLSQMLESLRAQLSVSGGEWRSVAMPVVTEVREDNPRLRASYLAALTPERLAEELRAGLGAKPISLVEPLTMAPDSLAAIHGVTPGIERWLNGNGIFFYWQFATLNAAGAAWLQHNLPAAADSFVRDHWIAQAARLARGLSAV